MFNQKDFEEKSNILMNIIEKTNIYDLEKQLIEINNNLCDSNIWLNPNQAANENKKHKAITQKIGTLKFLKEKLDFISEFKNICVSDADFKELNGYYEEFCKEIDVLETNTYLNKPEDKLNAIMTINAGAGGTEAANWAQIISRMYCRFAEKNNFSAEILDSEEHSEDPANCISSITIKFTGDFAYGLLKNESGVHRFIRISPYGSKDKRHTSCVAVDVTPEVTDDINIEIKKEDLEIIPRTAGGSGGQCQNRTKSAAHILHIPSGIKVFSRTQTSIHQNIKIGIDLIKSKLYQIELDKRMQKEQNRIDNQMDNSFGSQIRNYTFNPFQLVKDLRSEYETSDTQSVLDGDIIKIIKSVLVSNAN